MEPRPRNLMFLFGLAPMGLGCAERNPLPSSESGTGDGSTSTDGGDGDGDEGSDTGSVEELCEAYAVGYTLCYYGYGYDEAVEFCEYARAWYAMYSTPECYAAWVARRVCFANLTECVEPLYACPDERQAQIQACYYDDGIYTGCTLYGHLVAECKGAAAGEAADAQCEAFVEEAYSAYNGSCGYAYYEMMACISKLDCQALDSPQLQQEACGPEIAEVEQWC